MLNLSSTQQMAPVCPPFHGFQKIKRTTFGAVYNYKILKTKFRQNRSTDCKVEKKHKNKKVIPFTAVKVNIIIQNFAAVPFKLL